MISKIEDQPEVEYAGDVLVRQSAGGGCLALETSSSHAASADLNFDLVSVDGDIDWGILTHDSPRR